jgi:hypothetical protein
MLRSPLKRIFELDLRSLAICRIGFGLFSIIDCIFRLQNFEAHYTEFGVLPLDLLNSQYVPKGPCLHCLSSAPSWMVGMFALHILFAFLMMIGWRTRITTLLTWFFTISLHYRMPLIIDGGDVLLRCCLLWLFFLPAGEYFSLDARRKPTAEPRPTQSIWWMNLMLPLQLFMLYFCSATLKTGADWWPNGTAIGFALSLEAFVTPLGRWLTQFPEGLKVLTRIIFLVELWAPFLFLCWGRLRMLAVIIFIGFHFGLSMCMDLALFPWIAYSALLSLMPSEFWDYVLHAFKKLKISIKISKTNFENLLSPSKFQIYTAVLAGFFFSIGIAWNIYSYYKATLPRPIAKAGQWVHVDQYWGMFAPYPLKDSGWYEFGLHLWNGEYVYTFVHDTMEKEWDEVKGTPISGHKHFVDQRWRKYLINLWDKGNSKFRPALADYLCRKWNRDAVAASEKATGLDMEFTLFVNKKYLSPPREPSNINLGKYDCPKD